MFPYALHASRMSTPEVRCFTELAHSQKTCSGMHPPGSVCHDGAQSQHPRMAQGLGCHASNSSRPGCIAASVPVRSALAPRLWGRLEVCTARTHLLAEPSVGAVGAMLLLLVPPGILQLPVRIVLHVCCISVLLATFSKPGCLPVSTLLCSSATYADAFTGAKATCRAPLTATLSLSGLTCE